MQSMKEATANAAVSAKASMEKTKAVVKEKVEKVLAHDPAEKQMATEKKEDRVAIAEQKKQEAKALNAAAKQAAHAPGGHKANYTTSGTAAGTQTQKSHSGSGDHTGRPMSPMPDRGVGHPYGGLVDEGVVRPHPSGLRGEKTNVEGGGYGYDSIDTTEQGSGGHSGYGRGGTHFSA